MRAAFQSWFGLEPGATRVLVALYGEGPHKPLALATAAFVGPATLARHHIPNLRRALDSEAIDYCPNEGYRLTESGRAECLAVLWSMGEELRRAS